MGFSWDEIHEEAETLEHHISERFEDRIEEMLGHPERDPHGHPIPARDGTVDDLPTRSLADLTEGDAASINHIADEDGDLLEQRGGACYPGQRWRCWRRAPSTDSWSWPWMAPSSSSGGRWRRRWSVEA